MVSNFAKVENSLMQISFIINKVDSNYHVVNVLQENSGINGKENPLRMID